MKSEKLKAYLALTIVALIWGVGGAVIKGTLSYIPPYTFLFYRFVIVCIVTIPWYIFYLKKHPLRKEDWFPLTILGYLATTVYLGFVFQGFDRTTAIDGTVLGVISPLFIVVLGATFLKEKVSRNEKIGIAIAMAGTLVTVIQPVFEGKVFAFENTIGNILMVIAAILWSVFTFISKKMFRHFTPLHITLHGSIVALPTLAILALFEQHFSLPPILPILANPTALFGLLYMSLLSYIAAYFLHEYAMSKIHISDGAIFTYLHPLATVPVAYFWLGETITSWFIAGAILIAIGVVFAERK